MHSSLRLESVNNTPIVEYRVIDGHPVPYKVTVQRRILTPEGEEYIDGASDWQTVTIRDVLEQLQLNGPVAEWLRTKTRVDCSAACFAKYEDLDDSAYLWNVNAGKGEMYRFSLRAIDTGFDLRTHPEMKVVLPPDITYPAEFICDGAEPGSEHREIVRSENELRLALRAQGFRV